MTLDINVQYSPNAGQSIHKCRFKSCLTNRHTPPPFLLPLSLGNKVYAFLKEKERLKGSDILIPCTFHVDKFPADAKLLEIKWDFNGRRILTYDNGVSTLDPRFSLNSNSAPRGVASLSVSNTQVSDGGIYTCIITYGTEHQEKEIILEIQVVSENKESVLRASITGFYPQDLDVKWLRDGEILPGVTVNKSQRDPDGTHSTTSTVTIVPTKENRNQIFSIRLQHFSLIVPLQEDFQLIYGVTMCFVLPIAPSVVISHEPFYVNKEQTLMCRVWGYYPESIAVSWLVSGSRVEASEIKRINSSALESSYQFLPTAESQGMEISCVVEHQALTQPLVETLKVQLTDDEQHGASVVMGPYRTNGCYQEKTSCGDEKQLSNREGSVAGKLCSPSTEFIREILGKCMIHGSVDSLDVTKTHVAVLRKGSLENCGNETPESVLNEKSDERPEILDCQAVCVNIVSANDVVENSTMSVNGEKEKESGPECDLKAQHAGKAASKSFATNKGSECGIEVKGEVSACVDVCDHKPLVQRKMYLKTKVCCSPEGTNNWQMPGVWLGSQSVTKKSYASGEQKDGLSVPVPTEVNVTDSAPAESIKEACEISPDTDRVKCGLSVNTECVSDCVSECVTQISGKKPPTTHECKMQSVHGVDKDTEACVSDLALLDQKQETEWCVTSCIGTHVLNVLQAKERPRSLLKGCTMDKQVPSPLVKDKPFYVNEGQTLICRVLGYYPESIAFLPTAESQGMEISCVVEHQALIQPLVQTLGGQFTKFE
ncbi:hypothetical protein XELAEV_18003407mg [Xenopus laevis]|nr:hypothetical protein XELAEV_18003407mg [Xenopus laevis]